MHQSRSGKEISNKVRVTPQSSPDFMNGYAKSYASIDKAKAMPPVSQSCLYNGSKPASSDHFHDDQQHLRSLTSRTQKQEVKKYVIEATKHLVELCNAYGNEIDDSDANEILEALGGKSPICY